MLGSILGKFSNEIEALSGDQQHDRLQHGPCCNCHQSQPSHSGEHLALRHGNHGNQMNSSVHHVLQSYNFNVTVVEIDAFVRVHAVVESAITTCAVPVLKINHVLQCLVLVQTSTTHIVGPKRS